MALPTFVAAGTQVNATTGITVVWPAGYADNDIGILVVESANQAVTTPSGWTEVTGSHQGTGTGGVAGGVRAEVFYKLASGTEANVSVADSGDHTTGQIFVFRGVDTTTPINTGAGAVITPASTSWTLPGVTTTVNDCLIVHCCATDRDATSTANLSGYTNANLANITERGDGSHATSSGGGIIVVTGEMATAGSTGSTTCTNAASVVGAIVTIALAGAGGTTYNQSLTATAAWATSLTKSVVFGATLTASTSRAATLIASLTIRQTITATASRAASIATNLIVGGITRPFRAMVSFVKSVVRSVLG